MPRTIAQVILRVLSELKAATRAMCGRTWSAGIDVAKRSTIGGIVVLLASGTCSATAVAVFWTDAWVVLGTDSKRTVDGKPVTLCKLEHVNDVYFAMDGHVNNVKIDYDARKIARTVMAGPGTIQARFDEFRRQVTAKIPNLVQHESPHPTAPPALVSPASDRRWHPHAIFSRCTADNSPMRKTNAGSNASTGGSLTSPYNWTTSPQSKNNEEILAGQEALPTETGSNG
jgi:hypothetical protein